MPPAVPSGHQRATYGLHTAEAGRLGLDCSDRPVPYLTLVLEAEIISALSGGLSSLRGCLLGLVVATASNLFLR